MHQKFLLETGFRGAYLNGTLPANKLAEFEKWLHLSIFECCLLLQTLNCFVLIIDMNHYSIRSPICDSKRCELNCERKACFTLQRTPVRHEQSNREQWSKLSELGEYPNEWIPVCLLQGRKRLSRHCLLAHTIQVIWFFFLQKESVNIIGEASALRDFLWKELLQVTTNFVYFKQS